MATQSFAQTSFDPLTVGIGARALGMGKVYTAIAEEADTIFSNPAGLGEIDSFKFTSMSGKVLEDANYIVWGGVYPLGRQSAIGIGYAGAFVSGIEMRDHTGNLSQKANFGNSVLLATYGKKLSERTSVGISLKYYFTDGTENNSGDSQAWNADLGLLQNDLGWLSLGVVGQNILEAGSIKLGTKMHLLGAGYNAAFLSPLELVAAVDSIFNLQSSRSMTTQAGVEFSPLSALTLRAGTSSDNVFSAGMSLRFAGMGLHYAYQPLAQYVSISFDERGWPAEWPRDAVISKVAH